MVTCRNCGEENPERFRFCGSCGVALDVDGPAIVEERKIVSVLFVDLVDFTRRAHAADPEDVRASLSRYYSRLKQEIERFGGRVEKFIGDAVVAIFGAPVTHEDDSERAVRAALRIIEAIAELNEANPALDLSVRAAVDTGEVVVALGARTDAAQAIVGDVVNTAARLQAIAAPGTVVVGEATYRSTRDFIDYQALDPVSLKGKPGLVPVWRALAARSRYGVDVGHETPTPFVGRTFELAALENAFERVLHDRALHLVSIVGEPGVGKTRLVAEFFTRVDNRQDVTFWRQGRSLPYGEGISFWALAEVVKAHAGILETDPPGAARAKLEVAISAVIDDTIDREWLAARLAPLVGASAPTTSDAVDRQESFTAWTRFIEAIALHRPLVLVLEDLHWAGPAMLDFLDHLIEWASSAPVLMICTTRPELYEHRPEWGGGKRSSLTMTLTPLSEEESARLIEALFAEASLTPALRTALLERAGGNPLYAEEFARMLRDRPPRDATMLERAEVDVALPDSIQALIAARLDALSVEHKSLLHDASVVGKVFWVGALCALGGAPEATVVGLLHELSAREFVRRLRYSSIADQDQYSFRHALIKDVSYAQMPRAVRGLKHKGVAAWIEQIADERTIDHAELLAYHRRRSYELARETGASDQLPELRGLARRALMLAGERAMQLDVAGAERYYRDALELSDDDPRDKATISADLVDASWLAGHITSSDAERAYEEAIEELLGCGERACAGEVMVKLSRVRWERGDRSASRASLARAVELLEQEEPGRELVFAYAQTAGEKWASGATAECLEWSDKTIALAAQLGIEDQAIRAHGFKGCARCDRGDLLGLEDVRRALGLALEAGLGRETCIQYNNLGYLQWLCSGPSQAAETYREGISFAEGRGLGLEALWMRTSLEETLFDLGRWDEVIDTAEETIRRSEECDFREAMLVAGADKLHVLVRRGKGTDAAPLRSELVRHARESGEAQTRVPVILLDALGAEGAAAIGVARELSDVVLADASFEWLRHLPDVCRVLARAKLTDALAQVLDRIQTPYPRHRHSSTAGRAALAEAVGDVDAAAELYGRAASAWRDFGCVFEHGQALLGGGRVLLRSGRAADAADRLGRARDIFSSLGVRPEEAEAAAHLHEIEVRAPR